MNEHRWRVPKEEEKKYALYWVKRNRIGKVVLPICAFLLMLAGFVLFVTIILGSCKTQLTYIITFLYGAALVLAIGVVVYNIITEGEKVRLVSKGEFQIIEANIQFAGKKCTAVYEYDAIDIPQKESFPNNTPVTIPRSIKKAAKDKDPGYIICFPGGSNRVINTSVFITEKTL